jgi:hypothetical protein
MPQVDPRDIKTFIRMYVEVGACVWGLRAFETEVWLVAALLLAYFSGHLLQGLVKWAAPKGAVIIMLPVALAGVAAGMQLASLPILLPALFATGCSLGPILTPVSGRPRIRLHKIGAKLIGMIGAVAVLGGPLVFGAIAIIAAVIHSALIASPDVRPAEPGIRLWTSMDFINIFHQSSYFAFVFLFWSLWPQAVDWAPALLFSLGWIGYWAMELRLTDPSAPYRPRLLAAGHLVVALVLIAMAAFPSPPLLMLGWFLTGVGGGTCYTMERASSGKPGRLSDDIGAVLGVATGAGIVALMHTSRAALVAGACYALVAVYLAWTTRCTYESRRAAT